MNSHVGPAVVPCLRLPVLWAQTDSQLEGCGEHHVGHHTQQTWQTQRRQEVRDRERDPDILLRLHFSSVTTWWQCYTVLGWIHSETINLTSECHARNHLIHRIKYVIHHISSSTFYIFWQLFKFRVFLFCPKICNTNFEFPWWKATFYSSASVKGKSYI